MLSVFSYEPEKGLANQKHLIVQGEQHLLAGDFAQAQRCFSQLLQADPGEIEALNNMAVISFHTNRVDESERFLLSALELDPSRQAILINLWALYMKMGESHLARGLLEGILCANPKDSDDVLGAKCLHKQSVQLAANNCESKLKTNGAADIIQKKPGLLHPITPQKADVRDAGGVKTELRIERFGDQDCGWSVIPGLLGKDSVIYCVGCGENISFDMALMKYLGCEIHAFDPTPKSIRYLRSLVLPKEYVFFEIGLAHFDGIAKFNPPLNHDHVSHTLCDRPATTDRAISVPMKRLKTIMQELGHGRIDLLKIDIEGAEYGVIDDLVKNDIPVGQICVEFHHFLDGHNIETTLRAIIQLIQGGYLLYAVHNHTDYCFVKKPLLAIFSEGNGRY